MRKLLLLLLVVPAGFAQDGADDMEDLKARVAQATARAEQEIARAKQLRAELEMAHARLTEAMARNRELAEKAEELARQVRSATEVNDRNTATVKKMSVTVRQVTSLVAKANLLTTVKLVTAYLPVRIRAYQHQFGAAPPPALRELVASDKRFGSLAIEGNTTNESAEALLAALRRPDFLARTSGDSPVLIDVCNTDTDRFNQPPAGSRSIDALELADAWGNPVVYIPKANYGEPIRVVTAAGKTVDVFARKKSDGAYYNPSTYQLVSLGPNGVPDVPGAKDYDDVTNFAWK